jgi:hypothetical protein
MDASYFDDWLRAKDAAEAVGVLPPNLYVAVKVHRIATQQVIGLTLYYKPDCERARAERQAKKQREAA